jgi:transposase
MLLTRRRIVACRGERYWPRPNSPRGKSRTPSGGESSLWCLRGQHARANASIDASLAAAASPSRRGLCSRRSCTYCARVASGKRCPMSASAVPVPSTSASWNGSEPASSAPYGVRDWPSMMRWKASRGAGKAWMAHSSKLLWPKNPSGQTRRIGGKKGSKRMLLVDAHGIPLSIIVTAANRHDVSQLEPVLDAIVVRRPRVRARHRQHLCADAGFRGAPAEKAIRYRAIFPTYVRASRNIAQRSDIRRDAGWSRSPTPGSIGSASCWSAMRRRIAHTWRSTCSPLQLSASDAYQHA